MDDVRVGRYLRALRVRRRLSQQELAAVAALSQSTVSLVERGHLDSLSVRTLRRLFAALDARFEGQVTWRAGALDRLVDERHAALVEVVVSDLRAAGWEVLVEVSFNHYGDRGSVDVLAVHHRSRSALVVEVKSELSLVEETNRRLDVKVRLAPALVEQRFRVHPVVVGRLLVLPRSTTAFRRVESLRATFDAVLPGRTVDARRWLRRPAGPFAGIAFVSVTNRRGRRSDQAARTEGSEADLRAEPVRPAPATNAVGKRRSCRSSDHGGW